MFCNIIRLDTKYSLLNVAHVMVYCFYYLLPGILRYIFRFPQLNFDHNCSVTVMTANVVFYRNRAPSRSVYATNTSNGGTRKILYRTEVFAFNVRAYNTDAPTVEQ